VKKLDIASIIGMVMCGFFLIYGICSGDDGAAALGNFYDFSSILITFGGAICATLASHSMSDFLAGLKSFLLIFKTPALDTPHRPLKSRFFITEPPLYLMMAGAKSLKPCELAHRRAKAPE